jgi:hypothetical protein
LQGALLTETVLLQEILGRIEDAFCYSAASVDLVKLFHIYVYENMKWNNHIKHLSSKLNTSYYTISSLKNVMSPCVLRTMYFGCFHVHLTYGLTLCGGDPESIRIF